jgi:hypothetical protein
MGKREQDTSLEQLLREALSARDRAPQSECLDADVLAAWADGALSGSERSFAEAHAARCARCQAMLAAMVQTAPELAAAAPALSIRRWITFLTPLAAGAVALALWFLVEPRSSIAPRSQPPPDRPPVSTAVPPPPASTTTGAAAPTAPAAESERKVEGDRAKDARSLDASRRRDQRDQEVGKETRLADTTNANAAPPSSAKAAETPPTNPAAPLAKADPAPQRQNEVPPPTVSEQRLRQPASPPPSMQAAGARSTQAADQQVAQSDLKQSSDQFRSMARQESGRGGGAGQLGFLGPTTIIAVPQSSVRWRIMVGRIIEHSLDGGATWATQYTAPQSSLLVAGVAPSPTAAWIVGRAGLVLQTSDGRTWRRVEFAHAVDLISVNASDARTATIVTADKRSFLTIDGGATWIERKN